MRVLLDTNFILECVKNKIDLSELEIYGNIILPVQVYSELQLISLDSRQKEKDKKIARLALQIIEERRFDKTSLGNEKVDDGIVNYVRRNENIIVATLDKELKDRLDGISKTLTIRNKKKIVLL
jgi:hypothetical protein